MDKVNQYESDKTSEERVTDKPSKGAATNVMSYTVKGSADMKQLSYARLNLAQKLVSIQQEVTNNIVSCSIAETKFDIAQCRRVFVQAASWTKTSVKEETDLIQLIGEASDFEVETSFEDYEF